MNQIQFEMESPILGCFLLAGDPDALPDQAYIYRESGVDFIEFGLPSFEPFLDGPVITNAMARACAAGVPLQYVREQLIETRCIFPGKPIVVVSYGNYDLDQLRTSDGALLFDAQLNLSDLSTTRAGAGRSGGRFRDLPSVAFVSYEAGESEIEEARWACGYVLLQASPGRTGSSHQLDAGNREKIRLLRRSGIQLPILLGIGIFTIQQVSTAVKLGANGVILGTRCLVEASKGPAALRQFLGQARAALNAAR